MGTTKLQSVVDLNEVGAGERSANAPAWRSVLEEAKAIPAPAAAVDAIDIVIKEQGPCQAPGCNCGFEIRSRRLLSLIIGDSAGWRAGVMEVWAYQARADFFCRAYALIRDEEGRARAEMAS